MRRRARFLRKARELAYRDLGGLVFDLHRFGQRNDPLVLAKLATLRQIDTEVRELEAVLRERRPVTVLREVGIAACPRCAAIHGSDDRFCPGCGLAFDAKADRPISTAPVSPQAQAQTPVPTTTPAAPTTEAPKPTPEPAQPPVTPTAAPVRAPGSAQEDEPTQIIHPSSSGR
jgi:cell division septation protein DedD